MAYFRATALAARVPTYRVIADRSGTEGVTLPVPLMNIVNGGKHADNGLALQEFMIAPVGFSKFSEALRAGAEVFHHLKKILHRQGSEAVSEQLQRSGMSIPGFRRDPRVIRQVLDRYIPTITILGSVFVAVLAGFADLTNALGTGTGILLTVGIVYRLYEDLAKQQLFESNPMLAKLVGG
jgi:preprotein translocase subunit SecY